METVTKLFRSFLVLVATLLLVMYVATLVGYEGLQIRSTLLLPPLMSYWIGWALFIAQSYLFFGIVWGIYSKRILKLMLPYIALEKILVLAFPATFVPSNILLLIYGFGGLLVLRTWRGRVKSILFSVGIICIFQIVRNLIYTQILFTSVLALDPYVGLVLSIDLIILLLIFYLKGAIVNENKLPTSLENPFPINPEIDRDDFESSQQYQRLVELIGWERVVASVIWLGLQLVAWISILIIAHILDNLFVEMLILTLSYAVYGYIVRYRWHSNWCTLVSGLIFFTAARLIPPYQYSQLIPVVLSMFLVYGSFRVAMATDNKKDLENRLAILERHVESQSKFILEFYCDYKQMTELAKMKGLTPREIKLLRLYYCDKAPWAKINISFIGSESTLRKELKIATDKFNKTP